MMNRKILSLCMLALLPIWTIAQNMNTVEMADTMRANGKINVVVGVIAIVFACIVSFLVYLEIQLKKIEKSKQNIF